MQRTLIAQAPITKLLVRLFTRASIPTATIAAASSVSSARSSSRSTRSSSLDEDRILRAFLSVVRATLRTNYFQRGADGRPRAARVVQARPVADRRSAAPEAEVRDLRLLAARRGRPPARRQGRPRRHALVGPPRGLPHRGPRSDEGADGQERGDRAGRREGRLRRQAPAVRRRARGAAGGGDRLLPHVPQRAARPHRQHRRAATSSRRSASSATTRTTPISSSPPTRAPPTFSDIANDDLGRVRLLARRRVRLRRLAGLRPQGDGDHRPRRLGVGQAPLPRARARHPARATSRSSGSATCPATCSATACCSRATSGCSARSTTRTSSSTRPRPGGELRRAQAPVRARRARSWSDYDRALISAGGGVWPRSAKSIPLSAEAARRSASTPSELSPDRADPGDPARARRPALERRHRHLRQGVRPRRTPTSATGATTPCGSTAGAALSRRRRGRQPRLHPARADRVRAGRRPDQHRRDRQLAGVNCSDHEVNIKILLDALVADGDMTEKQRNELLRRDDRRGRRAGAATTATRRPRR